MKTTLSITVDSETYVKCKKEALNISKVCNEALSRAVMLGSPELERKSAHIKKEIEELQRIEQDMKEAQDIQIENENKFLEAFLRETGNNVRENVNMLEYWSQKTGKTPNELIERKLIYLKVIEDSKNLVTVPENSADESKITEAKP